MLNAIADDVDSVPRWFFAVGGLQTMEAELPVNKVIELRRLVGYPGPADLINYLQDLTAAGFIAHYGEGLIQHELVFNAGSFGGYDEVVQTAALIRLFHSMTSDLQPNRGKGTLQPRKARPARPGTDELIEPLSEILKLLNERFRTNFADADKEFLNVLEQKLDADGVAASFAVNTRENARLTFEHKVRDHVRDLIDTDFTFFKQINDKPQFAQFLNDLLFDRYAERKGREDKIPA